MYAIVILLTISLMGVAVIQSVDGNKSNDNFLSLRSFDNKTNSYSIYDGTVNITCSAPPCSGGWM